jgi:DNA-binding NtrC family response regulator
MGGFMSERAIKIRELSIERWGPKYAVEMVGQSQAIKKLQAKIEKVARYREPVLLTGESGAGKELIARSIYLLAGNTNEPFVSINCPQYREGNLTASELFGHKKGSFTGAVADRKGAWGEADGGVLFMDEIADLHQSAQAMLLRALSTGEYRPLGSEQTLTANVRVVAATNKSLNQLMFENEFRHDLFFRLRLFHLPVPSLGERGDDWRIILEYVLLQLRKKYGVAKHFSPSAIRLLERCQWPGNVRQVLGVATMGYAMADGLEIQPSDFASQIEEENVLMESQDNLYELIVCNGEDFWEVVYRPFMYRDLNRSQVKKFIRQGMMEAEGNYRKLLDLLHLPNSSYQRFMDFLRHHDLKP